MDPSNYYYKVCRNGRKAFYEKQSDGSYIRIAKKNIAPIEDEILEHDYKLDYLSEKIKLDERCKRLLEELERINSKLEKINLELGEEYKSKEEELKSKAKKTKEEPQYKGAHHYWARFFGSRGEQTEKERQKEWEDFWNSFFESKPGFKQGEQTKNGEDFTGGSFRKEKRSDEKSKSSGKKITAEQILMKHGILLSVNETFHNCKKRYKMWIVKNHPDKGGNLEDCKNVISAFDEVFGNQ